MSDRSWGQDQQPAWIDIAVMGETGIGKSSFIQRATGKRDIPIGHGLHRGTTYIKAYELVLKSPEDGSTLYLRLIDCPGFNDISRPDKEIVKEILDWLWQMYGEQRKLHGIIYTIGIDKPRVTGFGLRSIAVFRELVGENFYANVVLALSCWDKLANELQGVRRQQQLKCTPELWGELANKGSQIRRIGIQSSRPGSSSTRRAQNPPNATADLSVIYEIARNHRPLWTAAQEQMSHGLSTSQTSATREFDDWEYYWKQVRRMEIQHERATEDSNRRQSSHQEELDNKLDSRRLAMSRALEEQDLQFARDQKRRDKIRREVDDLQRRLNVAREAQGGSTTAKLQDAKADRNKKRDLLAEKECALGKLLQKHCRQWQKYNKEKKFQIRCAGSAKCERSHVIKTRSEDYYHCCFCANDNYDHCMKAGPRCGSKQHPDMAPISPAHWGFERVAVSDTVERVRLR